jgi:hypothetical protein
MPEEDIETEDEQIAADASFVQASSGASVSTAESTTRSARAVALFQLIEGPAAPQDIGDSTEITAGQAHSALRELRDRGLIETLIPEEASDGPVFGAVPRGENAVFYIETQTA